MYGNQGRAGSKVDMLAPPMPEPNGLHQNAGNLNGRIWAATEMLERLGSRILGPGPMNAATDQKDPREPSTLEHIDAAHQGMNRLEQQINQLLQAIG